MIDKKRLAKRIEAKFDSVEAFAKTVETLTLRTIQNMLSLDVDFAWSSVSAVARALGVKPETLLEKENKA